jgi:AcrR family transcriptional regulator
VSTAPTSDGPPANGPTRNSRQRARTRQKLTDATRALIAEKGVAGLRISEITERADVALGSFYNHFESKEELVEDVVAETIKALAEAMVEPMARHDDPAEAVSFATRRFVRLTWDNPDLAWLLVNLDSADAQFERAVLPVALGALERGIDAGRFYVADTHVALTGVVGGTLAVMRAILDGRYGSEAEFLHTQSVLRSIGLDPSDAREVATRPLAAFGVDGANGQSGD